MKHDNAPLGQIHVPYNWVYSNAASRIAATGFISSDIGKLALQLDNYSLWVLISSNGTWQDISGNTNLISHINDADPHPIYLTEIEADGLYIDKLYSGDPATGIGWRDLVSEIDPRSGGSAPNWTVFRNGIYFYAFPSNANREVFANFHIQHDYYMGSAIFPHIHFSVNTTSSGTVRWGIEYTVAKGHQQATGSIFEATTTFYMEQVITGVGDQYKHFVLEHPTGITPANLEPDAIVSCRIFRDATNILDTYPDNVFGIKVDLHYQCNTHATLNRLPNFYV